MTYFELLWITLKVIFRTFECRLFYDLGKKKFSFLTIIVEN